MNKIRIAGAAAGVVLVSGVVLQVSSAAFTDTVTNEDNSWAAGDVYLDGSASALFTATNMAPGWTETNCITVEYTGSLTPPSAVTLHAVVTETNDNATMQDGSDGLADDLQVELKIGVPGTDCTASAATFAALPTSYSGTLEAFNGASSKLSTGWTPDPNSATPQTVPFQFKVTMPTNVVNHAQGDGANADFVWTSSS